MSIISVLTIAANIFVLAVSIKDPMKTFRTPTSYFLVGIAFADLATAAVVEPCYYYCFFRLYLKGPGHASTRITCLTMFKIGQVLSAVTMNVSYITVLAFTLAQYAVVASPMKMAQRVTAKSVLILQLLIWIYALAFQTGSVLAADFLLMMKLNLYLHNILLTTLMLSLHAILYRAFRLKMAFSMRLQSESSRQIKENKTRRVHQERKFLVINLCLVTVLILTNIPNSVWWFLYVNELAKVFDSSAGNWLYYVDQVSSWSICIRLEATKVPHCTPQSCCCDCNCNRYRVVNEEKRLQRGSTRALGPWVHS